MTPRDQDEKVAYCGLVCSVCCHAHKGCPGCRAGGGDEHCHQRKCCAEFGLEGCWQCQRFPCGEGYFADEAWSGLCIALVCMVRVVGRQKLAARVESKLGATIDYGEHRFKDPQEIEALLLE